MGILDTVSTRDVSLGYRGTAAAWMRGGIHTTLARDRYHHLLDS